MDAGDLGILQLDLGLGQALLDRFLLLCPAPTQALLQLFLGRRSDEDVAGREARGLDLLHALHLDIQDDGLALGGLLLDRGLGGAVKIVAELRAVVQALAVDVWRGNGRESGARRVPLDEAVVGLELLELLLGHEVVVDAMLLAGPRATGRVGDGEREGVRVSLARVSGIALAYGRVDGWQRAYLEEELVEGPLADAGRARDDDGTGIANCRRVVSLDVLFPSFFSLRRQGTRILTRSHCVVKARAKDVDKRSE